MNRIAKNTNNNKKSEIINGESIMMWREQAFIY